MKFYKLFNPMFLLLFLSVNVFSDANHIKMYCPNPEDIQSHQQSNSWAQYKYTARTKIDLPETDNTLEMIGQGDSKKAITMQAATWTDRLFLCLYDFGQDVIVIFDTVLDKYVTHCYFNGNPRHSECISSDPKACPMVCELDHP